MVIDSRWSWNENGSRVGNNVGCKEVSISSLIHRSTTILFTRNNSLIQVGERFKNKYIHRRRQVNCSVLRNFYQLNRFVRDTPETNQEADDESENDKSFYDNDSTSKAGTKPKKKTYILAVDHKLLLKSARPCR